MTIPQAFPQLSGPSIETYDFTDFAEGTGLVEFLAGGTRDSVGVKYRLTQSAVQSSWESRYAEDRFKKTSTNTTMAQLLDLDFDTSTFARPRVLQGTMISAIPFSTNIQVSDCTGSVYVIVTLKVVATDGTTETTIVSTQSNTFTPPAGISFTKTYFSMLSAVPLTQVKKGEKLRITVELWGSKSAGTGDMGYALCFDPLNAVIDAENAAGNASQRLNQTAGYSKMSFLIPFRRQD